MLRTLEPWTNANTKARKEAGAKRKYLDNTKLKKYAPVSDMQAAVRL